MIIINDKFFTRRLSSTELYEYSNTVHQNIERSADKPTHQGHRRLEESPGHQFPLHLSREAHTTRAQHLVGG